MRAEATYWTPPAIAKRLGISPEKVLTWIARGELRAVNVADKMEGRPRWRIAPADLAAFEAGRAARPVIAPKRRRKQAAGVIEFF